MRLLISTDRGDEFEAVTVYPDADLDGDILVIDESGEPLIVYGWQCTIEVLNDQDQAFRPANVSRRWMQAERAMLESFPAPLPHIDFPAGWDRVEAGLEHMVA